MLREGRTQRVSGNTFMPWREIPAACRAALCPAVRSPLGHWARDEATGYRVDMRRLSCVSDELRDAVRSVEHTPILSANFETSVPGLYVIGPAAANASGPAMRFAFGARATAPRVSRHLSRSFGRRLVAPFANKRRQAQPEHGFTGAGGDQLEVAPVRTHNLLRDRKP